MKTFGRKWRKLRKASVNEEALGGEIAFSLHNGKTTTKATSRKKQSDFPPLLIYDHEDCNIFFEFYLNTCGGQNQQNVNVEKTKYTLCW